MITTNGGKTFEDVKIIKTDNLEEKNIYFEGLPYIENEILKIKAYTITNGEKKYLNLLSEDNGLDWKSK
ncbi:MAG: hypothetical protein GX682_05245 [Clostridiaceae bacterium]|nr:hypothetical protein [Clostridiaceae bacterium]